MTDNPCAIQGDQTLSDHIANQYARRMVALSNDLLHGTLSLDDYHARMQDAIRLSFLHQAVAGTHDDDERELKIKDQTRIESDIASQYQYLDNFMTDITAAVEKEGASLDFIPNRASLYAKAGGAEYWRQATAVDLPAMPRDGSSECLTNDDCFWTLDCEYDDQGNVTAVLATWNLGETEKHCETCLWRAENWNPLRIPISD